MIIIERFGRSINFIPYRYKLLEPLIVKIVIIAERGSRWNIGIAKFAKMQGNLQRRPTFDRHRSKEKKKGRLFTSLPSSFPLDNLTGYL